MAGYLDAYGAEDERRIHLVRRIVIVAVGVIAIALAAYLFFKNHAEKNAVNAFLAEVNSGRYQAAYRTWGCSDAHPCSGYSYQKFMEDWGPKPSHAPWKISDVDGCPTGVVITVAAQGAEPQPLWVQRADKSLSFSPWSECQGKRWRFRQFFQRVFGG